MRKLLPSFLIFLITLGLNIPNKHFRLFSDYRTYAKRLPDNKLILKDISNPFLVHSYDVNFDGYPDVFELYPIFLKYNKEVARSKYPLIYLFGKSYDGFVAVGDGEFLFDKTMDNLNGNESIRKFESSRDEEIDLGSIF